MKIESAHSWYMRQRQKGWHKWFAWYPIAIDLDTEVWLEYVERNITGMNHSARISTATYEYRDLLDKSKV